MKRLGWVMLLLPIVVLAEQPDKDFIIEVTNDVCSQHADPEFCRWQLENITAISGIISLNYASCVRNDKHTKDCDKTVEAFNYIQSKYDKNMTEMRE
ncbi:hypothetical protein Xsto_03792 [Xenorhabdus stockiae]|uniref:Uncharacterized protein n=1 Tax=Xenorhabdus stockiae TaxID=351614 RepID=A0A2D0KBE3_9GAMM|nr:hypothetical protein [Xenorhabdus stockiae]PHM60635.1 hypothetical protein Xsto_03792 [Xenorhabdus stockiae]